MGQVNQVGDTLLVYSSPEKTRIWSDTFLTLNIMTVFATAYFFIKLRHLLSDIGIIIPLLLVLIFGQGLIIIPEQRFIVVFQIFTWLTFAALVKVIVLQMIKSPLQRN
jgi:hypothetical protein